MTKMGSFPPPPPKSFSHFLGPWPWRLRIKMGLERDFHLMAKFSKSRNMLAVDQPRSYSYLLSIYLHCSIYNIYPLVILLFCTCALFLFSSLLFSSLPKRKRGKKKMTRKQQTAFINHNHCNI